MITRSIDSPASWRSDSSLALGHGAGVEAGDLIVVQVGDDAEGGGELVGEDAHGRGVHPLGLQPLLKLSEILAGRGEELG